MTQRYAALLRGVSPMNLKMPDLKTCLEQAGFTDVRTLLSSGNAVFSAPRASESTLERKIAKAMQEVLGRTFLTILRPIPELQRLIESDPYKKLKLAAGAKKVVTFLHEEPTARLKLPIELDGACILLMRGREVFSAYERTPKGPVFMTLIEKTYGQDLTTRTWDTVQKVAKG
jgi:uncharacterized protein (DUF1697 family)